MSTKFDRRYTLRCGQRGNDGFEIGTNDGVQQLHINFSVEKADVKAANTAKIQIWNLSETNLSVVEQKDCVIELKAGYGSDQAVVLVGNVTTSTTVMDNADRMTEIEVVDGRVELRDTMISISLNGQVDSREVYSTIATSMGLPIIMADELQFPVIPDGFYFVGKARACLTKIADYCGHAWTVQNGVLQVTYPGRPLGNVAHEISSDTGLVDIPKKITISSAEGQESLSGYEITYLMDASIGVNDIVFVRSRNVTGYFRVHKVTMDGDNMEGDWICTAEVMQIAQLPKQGG